MSDDELNEINRRGFENIRRNNNLAAAESLFTEIEARFATLDRSAPGLQERLATLQKMIADYQSLLEENKPIPVIDS